MPSENAEFVRRIFEAFPESQKRLRAGSLEMRPPLAEDIVWDASEIGLPDLGDGVVHGHAGVRRFWMAWLSAWDHVSFEYELFEAGDRVVAVINQQNIGTQVDIPLRYAQVWTFAKGEIVHWKIYNDPAEALEVAGMDPGLASGSNP